MRSSGNEFWQMIRQFFIVPLMAILLAGVFFIPAQAQEQIITSTYENAASDDADVVSIRPMAQNTDIYELLLHDQVVLRYRSMHQGLSARERAEIILQRAVEFGQAMQNGQLAVTIINGSNVITIDGRLFITVTEADYTANNSTGEGLANVWLLNIQAARENKVLLGAPSVPEDAQDNDAQDNDEQDKDTQDSSRGSSRRTGRTDKNKDGQAGPQEDPAPAEENKEATDNPEGTASPGAGETPGVGVPPDVEENQDAVEEETGKTAEETAVDCSAEETEMLQLINQERAKAGVAPLTMDARLVKVARMKSADMIAKNYFDHTSPTYGDPFTMMTNLGITYGYAGENLAGNPSLEGAHESLMGSPGHRKNILNPNYTHVGIGIIEGGPYGKMFTQLFISKP